MDPVGGLMKNSQTESVDDKKYIVLIIYDITDNKTRNKMVACLEKYGVRVQKFWGLYYQAEVSETDAGGPFFDWYGYGFTAHLSIR